MHVAPYSMEDDDPQKYFISGEAGIASDRAGMRADKQAPLIATTCWGLPLAPNKDLPGSFSII